jgi:cell wall-associated NlpC family hydrolase/SH3-like domain-containing protein
VAKDYAYASEDIPVLEEKKESAREIGELKKDALCYLIKDEGDWYYIESGEVRGFVETDKLITGEDAEPITKEHEEMAAYVSERTGMEFDVEDVASKAFDYVSKKENNAFAYERATVYQTVVERDPALPAKGKLNIREKAREDSRIVGVLPADGIVYVIADKDDDWVYVESGDVRGFVKSDLLIMSEDKKDASLEESAAGDLAEATIANGIVAAVIQEEEAVKAEVPADQMPEEESEGILTKDEADYATATTKVDPKDNKALYYTLTSIRSGVPDGMLRNSILQYASQFIGNPYVWGGTSLTNGADCSGFVLSIFAQYGYSLPHSSAEQATCGTPIDVEDALPGDLIFYGDDNGIYHVVIYAGDGKTIEAKSTKYGIVASKVSYSSAVAAVRIIEEKEAVRYDIPSGLGSVHTYMGWQKVTDRRSQQWAFKKAAGMTFDPEGFGVVDNRYVIACTSTFGNIGDYVDFYQEDGSVIPCIIGDFKNQSDAGCNKYGHMNGDCIIEFVVDQKSWYQGSHANPGTASCHPEWDQEITKAENVGSYYD